MEEIPDPTPGTGQFVIDVRAIGVNPVDTYIRAGTYGPREFPFTPGHDGAGVVSRVGSGCGVSVGERVYVCRSASGTYAERALCAWEHAGRLPDGLSFEQGAAVGVAYWTAWRAIHQRARLRPGERVLVHGGSGGVGVAAVQIARAAGAFVCASAGSGEGLDLVRREGAHASIDHTRQGYLDGSGELTGGNGWDVIIEMLANVNLDRDLGVLGRGGRVVVVGNRGRVEIDARQTMTRDLSVLGMSLFNASASELAEVRAGVGAGLEQGWLRPVVGRAMPLDQAPRAHEAIYERAHGKVVLVP